MKITIEGEAKEIAELVMQIQTRHEFDGISGRSGSLSKGIEDALNSMERSSFKEHFTRLPEPQQINGTARNPIC